MDNYKIIFFIFMPPTSEKLKGHIGLGLSIRLSEPTHGYILGRVLVEYLQFIPYRCP